MKIAINGAGIAGPTLAFWLRRSGHEVLLVEQAPHLRTGGYVTDFWGLGYDIAEKMGVLPRIRERGYQVREVRFVGRHGRKRGGFPVEIFERMAGGRYTSVGRSDIAASLFGALDGVETIFGDSIASLEEAGGGVRVGFDHAPAREVDLVVGADGLHSRVRRLAFGPQARFETSLGYHVVAFEAQGYRPRDELVYVSHGLPGRQISRFALRGDRTLFLLVLRDEYLPGDGLSGDAERKAAVAAAFAGGGWECPAILAAMRDARDFYFDRVSQIRMAGWSRGRTALIGDAASCVSLLAGEGTGLAMAQAYVLAGELRRCGDDYRAAFARYERLLKPFLERKQASAARFASSFAPRTRAGVVFRDAVTRLMGVPLVADLFLGRAVRDDIALPEYGS